MATNLNEYNLTHTHAPTITTPKGPHIYTGTSATQASNTTTRRGRIFIQTQSHCAEQPSTKYHKLKKTDGNQR